MNYKMIIHTTGQLLGVGSICMLLSAAVSLIYMEISGLWLLLASVIAGILFFVSRFFKPESDVFFAKEGLLTVAFAWIFLSLVGALPFFLSGEIPSYVDSLFETISGFTTTGATILGDVSVLSHGNLFWRSFTHWIGGMGVLVLLVALLPSVSGRSIHMLRAEMAGPTVGKLVPKAKETARILYIFYIALSLLQFILLLCGDMSPFESAIHTMSTAGTGGFGMLNSSIAEYSAYSQWVITVFMFIFSINFNLFFFFFIGKALSAFKSEELWVFTGIVVLSSLVIAFDLRNVYDSFGESIRHSFFQVSAYISTTGFATANTNTWPTLSKALLLLMMFMGGCAGSTAGGLKLSRVILLLKTMRNRVRRVIYPRTVSTVRFEGKSVDEEIVSGVITYFALYVFCIITLFIILSFEPFSFETNFSAAVSAFNNVGPLFGELGNFEAYSGFSKVILSFAMLLGRLEIYPLLILFMPSTWKK